MKLVLIGDGQEPKVIGMCDDLAAAVAGRSLTVEPDNRFHYVAIHRQILSTRTTDLLVEVSEVSSGLNQEVAIVIDADSQVRMLLPGWQPNA